MVEGSTTTGKRDNGVAVKTFLYIFTVLLGESKLQFFARLFLLFAIWHLADKGHRIGAATGLIVFLLLITFSLKKEFRILNKLRELFFSNKIQKGFMDFLIFLLWTTIAFPVVYCSKIIGIVQSLHDFVSGYIILGYAVSFVDSRAFNYILWDIVVIAMSMMLSLLYKDTIFSTIDVKGNNDNRSESMQKITKKNNLCFYVLMPLAIVLFLIKEYSCALVALSVVAFIFIINDKWLLRFFDDINEKEKDAILKLKKDATILKLKKDATILKLKKDATLLELKKSNYKTTKRIKQIHESLYFANIPAFAGLLILLCIAIIYQYVAIPLDESNDSLTSFIAGGSAMHMVFGNLIVLISLREDPNFEGVKE